MASNVKTDNTYRSDDLKSNDRTGMMDAAANGPCANRDFPDKAFDMAGAVGHSMQETGKYFEEKTKNTYQAICDFTKENPTAAVLVAFGLGTILARILPGR